jgi:hypothetical protein
LKTSNCVGYFNLRGWSVITNGIDDLAGGMVSEGAEERHRFCRLLVGMTKTPQQEIVEALQKRMPLETGQGIDD